MVGKGGSVKDGGEKGEGIRVVRNGGRDKGGKVEGLKVVKGKG